MYKLSLYSLFCVSIFLFSPIFHENEIFGHDFITDNEINFTTLVKKIEIELFLSNENFPNNITLSMDHADNADSLISDYHEIYNFELNDNEFLTKYNELSNTNNSTIHSTVILNLIDDALINYDRSLLLNIDLTNKSNLVDSSNRQNKNNDSIKNYEYYQILNKDNEITTDFDEIEIINYVYYESAMQILKEINNIFQNNLKSSETNINQTNNKYVKELEDNLLELQRLFENLSSPIQIMDLVHNNIHRNMEIVYNIKQK
ncbi:MAG: hypothetical protein ACPKQO_00595 [Nitrososphaeraceae archaeon]